MDALKVCILVRIRRPIAMGKETFIANADEMVPVNSLDIARYFCDPCRDGCSVAIARGFTVHPDGQKRVL